METKKARRRGRKLSTVVRIVKNISLYQSHFDIIEKEQIELSYFVRFILENEKENYLKLGEPICKFNNDGIITTTVSLYKDETEKIVGIDNFSNFIRWSLEQKNILKKYLK